MSRKIQLARYASLNIDSGKFCTSLVCRFPELSRN